MNQQERTLSALAALARALSHQIRTPLSVISNDLFSLQSGDAVEATARSVEKCKKISEILSIPERFLFRQEAPTQVSIQSILTSIFTLTEQSEDRATKGHSDQLRQVFLAINELLSIVSGAEVRSVTISHTSSQPIIKFVRTLKQDFTSRCSQNKIYNSFIEFFSETLQMDSILPPFIDAILWSHSAKSEVTITSELILTIEF